jgi:hypothetical protein
MENWKVFFAHENIMLEGLTKVQARTVALKWAASAIEIHPGYVPGWIVEDFFFTLIWREKEVAVCQRDASRFHMELPCMCEESITSLDDRKLPR